MQTRVIRIIVIIHLFARCVIAENGGSVKAGFPGNFFSALFGGNRNRFCDCQCGIPNTRNARLNGGKVLKPHEFPWLAWVNVKGRSDVAATIVNNRFVLTAATPVVGLLPFDLKVTLGAHYICFPELTSTNYSVAEILIHPDYAGQRRAGDLALLKLATAVLFERKIQPICLPTPGYKYNGQVSYIASWLKDANEKSCEPRRIGVPILERWDCPEAIYDSLGCVGESSAICKSDIGSGIYYQTRIGYYELVGVLSDQQECFHSQPHHSQSEQVQEMLPRYEDESRNIVFNSADNYLGWILSSTRDGCYCNKP